MFKKNRKEVIKPEKIDFKDLVEALDPWDIKQKPNFLKRYRYKQLGLILKKTVFVSEGEKPRIGYLPFDPKKECYRDPDTGAIYDATIKGDIAFFDSKKYMPIYNCRSIQNEFDIPEDLIQSRYNMGLLDGFSATDEQIIAEIRQYKLVMLLCIILAIVAIAGNVILFKEYSSNFEYLFKTLKAIADSQGIIIPEVG